MSRTGWHGNAYMLPDATFGPPGSEEIRYQTTVESSHRWKVRGTAEEWRSHVGEKCSGNSRLIVAVSSGFAGPLLSLAGSESGGIHFYGASSTGKSTALVVGGSVCGGGSPTGFVQNWRATVNGLEAMAEAHNDGTLFLDELAQVDPKDAADAAYLLANGQGKARMTKSMAAGRKLSWAILFVSAGELTLAEHVASAGKRTKGGAEVRLLNIRADAGQGLGLLENLHSASSPELFVEQLRDAALHFYGAPSRRYLEKLVNTHDLALSLIKTCKDDIWSAVPANAAGEVIRAATRFALIAAAGELATQWGLTGWQPGEPIRAAKQCLTEWIAARGTVGNSDLEVGISQVRAFIAKHGASRFQRLVKKTSGEMFADGAELVRDRAGFYRTNSATEETEFLILMDTFRNEVCAGQEWQSIARFLYDRGLLIRDGDNLTINPRLPGLGKTRVYCVRAAILEGREF